MDGPASLQPIVDICGSVGYNDKEIYREGGQGGFEIRTFVTVAGATEGRTGELWLYLPVPTFSVGCTIATMAVA